MLEDCFVLKKIIKSYYILNFIDNVGQNEKKRQNYNMLIEHHKNNILLDIYKLYC